MSINTRLEELYELDKKERTDTFLDRTVLEQNTKKRLVEVKSQLASIDTSEIWNCHYLAYLLHHSDDPQDYILAHEYATKAVAMGSRVTKWLYAATLDRMLVSQGKPQKFGTQFILDEQGNKQVIHPVDPTTTNEERQEYGVAPITQELTGVFGNRENQDKSDPRFDYLMEKYS